MDHKIDLANFTQRLNPMANLIQTQINPNGKHATETVHS